MILIMFINLLSPGKPVITQYAFMSHIQSLYTFDGVKMPRAFVVINLLTTSRLKLTLNGSK